MNQQSLILIVVLCGLLIVLAALQVAEALYEKYFYLHHTKRIREALKSLIPGAVWHERSGEKDPKISVRTDYFAQPARLLFTPGGLEKDAPRPHELTLSIKAYFPQCFSVQRRSFLPVQMYMRLVIRIGRWLGTNKAPIWRRVSTGDLRFDFFYEVGGADTAGIHSLLRDPSFLKSTKQLLSGRCRGVTCQNSEITCRFLFRRYRERPKLEQLNNAVEIMSSMQQLPVWLRYLERSPKIKSTSCLYS